MKSKTFYKYLPYIIIVLLLGVLFIVWNNPTTLTTTKTDTVWNTKIVTVNSVPEIKQVIKPVYIPVEYRPDSNCDTLKKQYNGLVEKHLTTNISNDTIRSGKSYVAIRDSVRENKIIGRSTTFSLVTPTVTVTNNIITPPTRKLLVGAGVASDLITNTQINVSVGYQDRRNNIYQFSYIQPINGRRLYGVQYQTPIKLKRESR